jgi:hypothetical protein
MKEAFKKEKNDALPQLQGMGGKEVSANEILVQALPQIAKGASEGRSA